METKTVAAEINPVKEKRRQLYDQYWAEVRSAAAAGKKIVYCTNATPIEFFRAMDFVPVFPSNVSATCSMAKVATEMCEAAEAAGYRPDLCSYGRTGIGDILMGETSPSPYGRLPKPDIIMTGCHDHIMIKWFEQLSRYYQVPMIVLDVPFTHSDTTQEDKEHARQYVAEQLRELVKLIEENTGRPFNWDRLQEMLTITKKSQELWQETLNMRRFIPAPFNAWDLFSDLLFPIRIYRGQAEAIDFYQSAMAFYQQRVDKKVGTIPEEKYRLHFNGLPPWFRMGFLARKLASYGAVPLTGAYGLSSRFEFLDPSQPIESYAAAVGKSYVLEGTMNKIDYVVDLINRFSLDGVMMVWSQTCRAFTVGMRDMMEIVEKRTGVPSVLVQADTCDARLVSDDKMIISIEAFMEILANRKKR